MLIAIEGIDGSGKGTQSINIVKELNNRGYKACLFSFPNYTETFFGKEVGKYLNGDYGKLNEIPVEFAALLYAGDRLEKKNELETHLANDEIVICDRYVPSNLAHQAAKRFQQEREKLIKWISTVEYSVYGLPKPDLTFLLDISIATSTELVLKKKKRDYTDDKLDLHEASFDYLREVRDVYLSLANTEGWKKIQCEKDGKLQDIQTISSAILDHILLQHE